jgi:formylglycine-generating enzyme required for sulfatase activity
MRISENFIFRLALFFLGSLWTYSTAVPIAAQDETAEASPIPFVQVPAGSFEMGSPKDSFPTFEFPPTRVEVSAFEISVEEITNSRYLEFCEETDRDLPDAPIWYRGAKDYFEEFASHPVVNVTWYDAVAFCEWHSEKEGKTIRLPTEAEWERASRFSDSGEAPIFPWGEHYPVHHHGEPDPKFANIIGPEDRYLYTAPGGEFETGASRIGGNAVMDLVGNVSEWCSDRFSYTPPEQADGAVKDPQGPDRGGRRVVKGSSFRDDTYLSRGAFRRGMTPTRTSDSVGFRVVRVP